MFISYFVKLCNRSLNFFQTQKSDGQVLIWLPFGVNIIFFQLLNFLVVYLWLNILKRLNFDHYSYLLTSIVLLHTKSCNIEVEKERERCLWLNSWLVQSINSVHIVTLEMFPYFTSHAVQPYPEKGRARSYWCEANESLTKRKR